MWGSYSVCVSATEHALSTSSSLRLVLGATSTTATNAANQDAYQLSLLKRATDWAERFVGYPLHVQAYNEAVPSFGGLNLMLSQAPIRAVLRFFDSTSTDEATEICSSEYRVDDADAGILSRAAGFRWTAGVQYGLDRFVVPGSESRPWLVEYVAGYTLDGVDTGSENWSTRGGTTSTGRTLPHDIEHAILKKAAELYVMQPGNVLSESAGDLSVTYANSATNYRSEAEELLGPYRRMK